MVHCSLRLFRHTTSQFISAFKWLFGVGIVITALLFFGDLCDLALEDDIEVIGTEGMTGTVGQFEVGRRGTVKYRIFRHPKQTPNARTEFLLRSVVADTERYMGTAFPAKTVVLILDDTWISEDNIGQMRYLLGATSFASTSHSLSALWMQIEIRPELESDDDDLKTVLAHEVAHYYWHHQVAGDKSTGFDLDEGAAHYLEYTLWGDNELVGSVEFARLCRGSEHGEGAIESYVRALETILDMDFSVAQVKQLLTGSEFAEYISQICSDQDTLARYATTGVFIQASEIMGFTRFRQAFREIWEFSQDEARDGLEVYDVHDILCNHAKYGSCGKIEAAFKEYGFDP